MKDNISNNLRRRIVRFSAMTPCTTAFIDARTPGSDQKENFCLIGDGVAENPDQVVHIDIPHGFNIGAAKQPKGCKNSHHSHDTEEVFMIFSGLWKFTWGEHGQDGELVLGRGDTISLPPNMFRGFEYVGDGSGFMYSILGLNSNGSAGSVVWAPYVFEQAKNHGLVLLEDGRLIDTAAGVSIPSDGTVMTPTSQAQVDDLDRWEVDDMIENMVTDPQLIDANKGGLTAISGVDEIAVIGVANDHEQIAEGGISRAHGFQLRRLHLSPQALIANHIRHEEEVLIVHDGQLNVECSGESFILEKGDLFSVPAAMPREYKNLSDEKLQLWVVRRGDMPAAATFVN